MKVKIKTKKEVELKTLLVDAGVRYWEDATVNGVEDEQGDLVPCREGERWKPIIDIGTGVITNWKQGTFANIHYKVCDDGVYHLADEQGNIVLTKEDYVIIGYKLIKPEYEQAALKICNSVGFLKSPYSFVFKSMPYEALKQAGVLDLWFELVYEEIEKTISMGNFDLKVTKNGIFHRNSNITSYVRSIYIKYNNFINHHEIINCYSFNIKDIILSSTGCENSETKLSQWLEVWKVYQEIVNLDVFSN